MIYQSEYRVREDGRIVSSHVFDKSIGTIRQALEMARRCPKCVGCICGQLLPEEVDRIRKCLNLPKYKTRRNKNV